MENSIITENIYIFEKVEYGQSMLTIFAHNIDLTQNSNTPWVNISLFPK